MKKSTTLLFFFVVSLIEFTPIVKGQELEYVPEEDRELLRNGGWELVYTQENNLISSYTVANEGIAFIQLVELGKYSVFLMDTLNNIIDKRGFDALKGGTLLMPYFYSDDEGHYLGPHFNRKYQIDFDKGKIKTNSDSYFRNKDLAKKTAISKTGHRFNIFVKLLDNSKQHVLTHEFRKKVDTLLVIDDNDKMLYNQHGRSSIQVAFLQNEAVVLNNPENLLYFFDLETKLIADSIALPYENTSSKWADFKIEKDKGSKKVYLFSEIEKSGKYWNLSMKEGQIHLTEEKIFSTVSLENAKVHNDIIYNLVYLKDLGAAAIYKKRISHNID